MCNARLRSLVILISIFAAAALLSKGCASSSSSSAPKETLFDTPQAAVDAFVDALRSNDQAKLTRIFGPDSEDIISSGDQVMDEFQAKQFLAAYDAKHSLQTEANGETTLVAIRDVPAGSFWINGRAMSVYNSFW